MGNAASEDTPTGRDSATTPDELSTRSLNREIVRALAAVGELVRIADRGSPLDPADQREVADIERQLGDLLHAAARQREAIALVPRVAALERREAQTQKDLVAMRHEIRRARFGPWNVAGLAIAAGLAIVGAFTGTLPVMGSVAIAVAGAAGAREAYRRRRHRE